MFLEHLSPVFLFCAAFCFLMTLYPVETGNFKLDGGAMFGVVPKPLWSRTNPADTNNMIDIAARSLLIEDGDRLILIDTGMGDKQSEKFFNYYYQWGDYSIDGSLHKLGFHRDDITDVFMTHLHFDHCGGSVSGIRTGRVMSPHLKMQASGPMKIIGTGQHNPILAKKRLF